MTATAGARRSPSVSLLTLKRLSLAHSTIYCGLLIVWLIPGLHRAEFVLGLSHGVGWIAMCVLILAALSARVVSLRIAVAVAVIGGVGPFVGSYELLRADRSSRAQTSPADDL